MLALRPTCENCNRPLPPDSTEAMICSFECTFCRPCAQEVLENVCPNCGGGFVSRPIRPRRDWRAGNDLTNHPASTRVKHAPVDLAAHRDFAAQVGRVPPHER